MKFGTTANMFEENSSIGSDYRYSTAILQPQQFRIAGLKRQYTPIPAKGEQALFTGNLVDSYCSNAIL